MIGRRVEPSTDGADRPRGFDAFELRLGDVMRGERATLAKSLLDVQRELRIKASYIAAIENCDPSAFETPGFIAGYVRSYARYLGLDPEWAYRRFCEESGFAVADGMSAAASGPAKAARKVEYDDPLANPNAIFVPRAESVFAGIQPGAVGSILVLLLLIGVIGYGGWRVLQEVQRVTLAPIDQSPDVVAELDPLAGARRAMGTAQDGAAESAPLAVAGGAAPASAEALDRLYRPQALDVPVLVARDGPIAAIDPASVGVLPDTRSATDDAVAAALADTTPLGSTPVQVVAPDAPELELLAVRPAWVRVQAADGTVIFEKILDAGERYTLPKTEEPPVLRVGESGALYFAVNGQTYGPAGPDGVVTKNVKLSPDALVQTYALADLSRDADLARYVAVAQADIPGSASPAGLDPLAGPSQ
ncbi:MAG: helix-turn-helix domain-containing protein [Rhodobacteraceae bacterium]|nr:helix-turn-helix domain-containing protein [Paracoccaceae bacterium]